MKIQPVKLVEETLDRVNLSDQWSERRHYGLLLENDSAKIEREGDEFNTCVFFRVKLTGRMENASMIDVVFRECDLSLLDMEGSFFCRVRFENCRMKGFQAIGSSFRDTVFARCSCHYSNFNESRMKNILLEKSVFQEAGLAMIDNQGIAVSECDFTGAEFVDTRLGKIDFSDSILAGIQAREADLKGITVNASQAVSLLEILGIHVK